MIRVRTLATTCARECVRSATAAGKSSGRGGGARAAVVARAFSEGSLPSAQPPFDTAVANAGPVQAEDPSAFQPGQHPQGNEETVEDVGELLRRQTQAVSHSQVFMVMLPTARVDSPVLHVAFFALVAFALPPATPVTLPL